MNCMVDSKENFKFDLGVIGLREGQQALIVRQKQRNTAHKLYSKLSSFNFFLLTSANVKSC